MRIEEMVEGIGLKRAIALRWAWVWVVVFLGTALACSDSTTVPEDAPEGHTVVRGGAAHQAGLNNPEVNCTECHGATLQGGADGEPSCFQCHGKKW